MLTNEERFVALYKEISDLCANTKWGDPFSYARGKEIYLAGVLGHKVADTYSGPDAFDEDGPCEYKTTIGDKMNATYSGISKQDTIEKQIEYLKTEKIGCYKNHYMARFEEGVLVEVYKIRGDVLLTVLTPKVVANFKTSHKRKDPRLSAVLSEKEIKKYGAKIWG